VVGSDPGSKHDKARSLAVTILTEDDFEKLLAGKLPTTSDKSQSTKGSPKSKQNGRAKQNSTAPREPKSSQSKKSPQRSMF
jgi:hypothetical protein